MKALIIAYIAGLTLSASATFACDEYVCEGGSNDYIRSEVYLEGGSYARGGDSEAYSAGKYIVDKGYGDAGRVRQEGGYRAFSAGPGEAAADGGSYNVFEHIQERRWQKFQGAPRD